MLSALEGPLSVVAVVGQYRTGKSFLLNRILLDLRGVSNGFSVGSTVHAAPPHKRGLPRGAASGASGLLCLLSPPWRRRAHARTCTRTQANAHARYARLTTRVLREREREKERESERKSAKTRTYKQTRTCTQEQSPSYKPTRAHTRTRANGPLAGQRVHQGAVALE